MLGDFTLPKLSRPMYRAGKAHLNRFHHISRYTMFEAPSCALDRSTVQTDSILGIRTLLKLFRPMFGAGKAHPCCSLNTSRQEQEHTGVAMN
jgi:hypothetical protein